MGVIINGKELESMTHDGVEVQTWTHNGVEVYSAGKMVTYMVDSGVSYQEKVKKGQSCLSPTTFTPSKSGWTFVGWREDATASGSVLGSKLMERSPITLYAVFKQTIALYYNGNGAEWGSTATQYGDRYYNNGNVANPSFQVSGNGFGKSNYNFQNWALNGGTRYNPGAWVTLDTSATMYAMWVERPKELQSNSGRTEGINGTFKDSDHKAGTYRYQITYPAFLSPPSLSGTANGSGYWEKHHGDSSISFENVTTTSATLVYTIYSNSGNNYTYQTWAEWTATGYRYQ